MLSPFCGEVATELDNAGLGGIVCGADQTLRSMSVNIVRGGIERSYAICDTSAHARYHDNASSIAKSYHLLCGCLRTHKYTRQVDLKHAVRIRSCVLECRCFLIDARRSDEAVQATLLVANLFHNLVEVIYVAHINLAVRKGCVELFLGAGCYGVEFRGRLRLAVEGVDYNDV